MTGTRTGIVRACGGGGGGDSGGAASRSAGSAAADAPPSIAGKRLASADGAAAEERSITPKWIKIEGNTLSAKTGKCEVCGMGKGGVSRVAAKRMAIAFIRKSAFLKQ
jgi:hypothetical protein